MKIEPTFLCFSVPHSGEPIECAMFVREGGAPVALAVNEGRLTSGAGPMHYERHEALKALDRSARFLNRLLEDEVPWKSLVSCAKSADRAHTPILALVLAADEAIARAVGPKAACVAGAGDRDFDRER